MGQYVEKCAQNEKTAKKRGHTIQVLVVLLCVFSLTKLLARCVDDDDDDDNNVRKILATISRICQYSTFCSQYTCSTFYIRARNSAFVRSFVGVFVLISLVGRLFHLFRINTAVNCACFRLIWISIHILSVENVFSLSRNYNYCYSLLHFMLKSFFNTIFCFSLS